MILLRRRRKNILFCLLIFFVIAPFISIGIANTVTVEPHGHPNGLTLMSNHAWFNFSKQMTFDEYIEITDDYVVLNDTKIQVHTSGSDMVNATIIFLSSDPDVNFQNRLILDMNATATSGSFIFNITSLKPYTTYLVKIGQINRYIKSNNVGRISFTNSHWSTQRIQVIRKTHVSGGSPLSVTKDDSTSGITTTYPETVTDDDGQTSGGISPIVVLCISAGAGIGLLAVLWYKLS